MQRRYVPLGLTSPADWNDRPVALVGGGPSLKGFDLSRLRDRFRVVAVNGSIFDIPWADAGFSLDRRAMRVWWPRLLQKTMPLYFAIPDNWLVNFCDHPNDNMRFVRRVHGCDFNSHERAISCGGTSGYGALQLAFKKGAPSVVLFGFDYGASPSGEWHHNEQHYTFFQRQRVSEWLQFANAFHVAAPVLARAGVRVLNASPNSAITCFPTCTPEEALNDPSFRRL